MPVGYTPGQGVNVASSVVDSQHVQRVRTYHQDESASVWTGRDIAYSTSSASATQVAAGAGIRNICTSLTVKFCAGATAPTAINTWVGLSDGSASAAAALIWQSAISLPATAGADNGVALSNLWLPGTANRAMGLFFVSAGGANTIQSISFSGTTIRE